ncbi:sigma-70 family RNA polymerase sigma factor [Compostibacter hankyongensis]|uniref:RNA polymerase sigma-70 factor n=1 Tax=Compostibacter hankyongensis TaxID=1007089 RepID=A0ABP8FCI7_9BACT
MHSGYTDDELLQLVKVSDETAFAEIYRRYWHKLYAVAVYHLHAGPGAEDVVQEVLAGLWLRRTELEITSLYAYLAAATRYAVFRQVARKNRERHILRGLSPEPVAVEEEIRVHFLQEMIREEVNRLPEKCRLVFRCSRDKGMSNKVIARKFGISEKAVEKHITYALRQLRTQLKHFSWLLF